MLLAAAGEPPEPEPPAGSAPAPEPEVLGGPAAFGEEARERRLWLPAGTALRERPDPRAPVLDTLTTPVELPVVERRGPWARVVRGALRAWVQVPGAGDPEDDGPARVLPGRGPDPELLERALARLGGAGEAGEVPSPGSLGPYALYTDVDDEELLAYLGRLTGDLHRVYRERYGLDPPDGGSGAAQGPPEAVVLFARQEDYLAFAESDVALAGLEAGGFAGFGLAALAAGGRSREETAALLVHELVHLINARTLGPRTPPWLEEGLANDLSFSRIDPPGRLDPDTLGGTASIRARWPAASSRDESVQGGVEVTVTSVGARAALERLSRALDRGELVPLAELGRLSWHRLVEPERRRLVYAQSAFFVRYLLEPDPAGESAGELPGLQGGGPEAPGAGLAAGFRTYLQRLATGRASGPDALPEALGTDWATLDRAFRRWLRQRTEVR